MQSNDALRKFWEQRLAEDWTASGVGYRALGRPFNRWMYRVRREVFLREAGALDFDPGTARVLDVGSGTGRYVHHWQELGVEDVTGCDLTEAAVLRLAERFPAARFHQADASRLGEVFDPASFDAVSCMDMLFHITDDERYRAALASIAEVLRPGGHFVLSENFLHRPEQRGPHQVNRRLEWIAAALAEAGLEIVHRTPMLVLMNAQVDAPVLWRKVWGGALRAVTLTPPTGWLAGAGLYPLERRLVQHRTESPTTELMICRRRP